MSGEPVEGAVTVIVNLSVTVSVPSLAVNVTV